MKIIWNEQYEIGIEVIDNQHRRIVEYINALDDLCRKGVEREVVNDVLHDLVDYTHSHFAFEEALMDEAGYSSLAAHQVTHRGFARQIDTLRRRFDDGEQVADKLTDLLEAWLLQHIMTDDEAYSGEVKEKILGQGRMAHENWVAKSYQRFFGN